MQEKSLSSPLLFFSAAAGGALILQKKLDLYHGKSLHRTFVCVYECQPGIHCNKCNKCNIALSSRTTGQLTNVAVPKIVTNCNKL
jgi:hypothetical protein